MHVKTRDHSQQVRRSQGRGRSYLHCITSANALAFFIRAFDGERLPSAAAIDLPLLHELLGRNERTKREIGVPFLLNDGIQT